MMHDRRPDEFHSAPVSRPRLRIYSPDNPVFQDWAHGKHFSVADTTGTPPDRHPPADDVFGWLVEAGIDIEKVDLIRTLLRYNQTQAAECFGLHPGTVSRFWARVQSEVWLALLAGKVREAVGERHDPVLDSLKGLVLHGVAAGDSRRVGDQVRSSLRLTDLVVALRAIRDDLRREGVYLCALRQSDGTVHLWPGRLPPDAGTTVLIPMPPPKDDRGAALAQAA
jgi:hypothetical protein